MITKEKLDKMDQCRHLLDAPAPEVCGELIEEIRRLREALEKWEAGAAEILPPGANPSEAEVAKMFFDSFEELKGELAAARKALMVCDGAMMGKVKPSSVAFKMINAILRPENSDLTQPDIT